MTGSILTFVNLVLPYILKAVEGYIDAQPIAEESVTRLNRMIGEGRGPTAEDFDWINGVIDADYRRLMSDSE